MSLNLNYEPEVLVSDITKLTEDEWRKYRHQGIGGSDAAAACGVSPWKTAKDLYDEKLQKLSDSEDDTNWVAKEIGKRLEELVVQIFMKKTGLKPYAVRKMFRHPLYPFMLANVDYFVKIDEKIYIIECKTSFSFYMDEWADNGVPYHYELQGRHYMAVTNVDGVIFLCLHGNNEDTFIMRRLERNLMQEESLISQESYFWNQNVLMGIEPEYTEKTDLVIKSIQEHYRKSDGSQVTLPSELSGNIVDYLQLKEQKAELEKQEKVLEEQIKQLYVPIQMAMGNADTGIIRIGDNQYQAGYNMRTRTSINKKNMEALKIRYPDICRKYSETQVSRSFYIKKIAS